MVGTHSRCFTELAPLAIWVVFLLRLKVSTPLVAKQTSLVVCENITWDVTMSYMLCFPNARKAGLNWSLEAAFANYNFFQISNAFHKTRN